MLKPKLKQEGVGKPTGRQKAWKANRKTGGMLKPKMKQEDLSKLKRRQKAWTSH
jgi:hypothetical protein